jgi:hypothetical protein
VAKDSRSGLWGAQERARKALVHANKVRERAKRALRAAAARERSAARHDAVVLGAVLVGQDVAGWIVGLAVGLTSVILAALLWSSRQL